MFDDSRAFVSRAFLQSELALDYRAYADEVDAELLARLTAWDERPPLKETSAEGAFTQTFFVDTWGYGDAGRVEKSSVTLIPKFRVTGEGAGGGSGEADLALGWFAGDPAATPQVLCEFKDIRSGLDAPQNRKGSTRSPAEQCLNYVRGARRGLFGNEAVQPWWGLVTDMNEFRLYWWDLAPRQYLRFVIRRPHDLLAGAYDLLSGGDDARFDRFLFWRLFQRDQLLSHAGAPPLLRLVQRQWVREKALEGEFYRDYKAVRERLFNVLRLENPGYGGSVVQLLRLSQKLLDRFIFAFFCEDMGERMLFPPQMIRDYLQSRSREIVYDPAGDDLWTFFKRLFARMNTGGDLGRMAVPHINGGLFAADPEIEALCLPNHVFAAAGQGANEGSLEADRATLFYLCARYNYASRGSARESLSLYTLGRIFEQSITELEYRAGELEGRPSLAKLSKRKRDGVYYTPEWVVNLLVEQALDPWFADAKAASGWPSEEPAPPDRAQVEAYEARLKALRLVDPACGSGAFLISAFRRLLDERRAVARQKADLAGGGVKGAVDDAALTTEILADNIHGVDINPASVEITKLALWLHSARPDAPLSSLDETIRCGNSLVGPDFWRGRPSGDEAERERINAFDWKAAFPRVWPPGREGGFDIVLGNPPYVKLQNLHTVDPKMADWLRADRGEAGFESTRTGNFDLYLPFIEQGLRLLGPGGRMAYIAPSLWTVNRYGEGLRRLVRRGRHLDRWIDFKAFQVFDEVITYTALQFFTRDPQDAVRISEAPDGKAADVDWSDAVLAVPYAAFAEDGEWLMATGAERALIDRLSATCLRLDDSSLTSAIYQGLITSADAIYHLQRFGNGRYLCKPKGTAPYEVAIEDAIMKPLVSGGEAKRYEVPRTSTYLLFPYERSPAGVMGLIGRANLQRRFPKAWAHLRSWEEALRAREGGAFDDKTWWRFGRNQSIDKQDIAKLIVAQTVPETRVCGDTAGDKYLNNVRVNGILPADGVDSAYLLGVLNGPTANFVFRRIGKPKAGGYFEANKQSSPPCPSPMPRPGIARRSRPWPASSRRCGPAGAKP
ncbi:MAG: Eco57I restriction-modification methylase domain-containing protein, partial [Caulobacteraceae bacterium]|nr:Eco57I restriction-modification methylase domain-containing protein [Caulobacteraceae bacterium]